MEHAMQSVYFLSASWKPGRLIYCAWSCQIYAQGKVAVLWTRTVIPYYLFRFGRKDFRFAWQSRRSRAASRLYLVMPRQQKRRLLPSQQAAFLFLPPI